MSFRIATAQLWVHDQDEALRFYTEKVGMVVRSDVTMPEMGDFRWLTVGPAGQDDVAIVLLAIPGPPGVGGRNGGEGRGPLAEGFAGTNFLPPGDCPAAHEGVSRPGLP